MCTTNIISLVKKHNVNPAFFRLAFMWRKHQRWAWPSSGEKNTLRTPYSQRIDQI